MAHPRRAGALVLAGERARQRITATSAVSRTLIRRASRTVNTRRLTSWPTSGPGRPSSFQESAKASTATFIVTGPNTGSRQQTKGATIITTHNVKRIAGKALLSGGIALAVLGLSSSTA